MQSVPAEGVTLEHRRRPSPAGLRRLGMPVIGGLFAGRGPSCRAKDCTTRGYAESMAGEQDKDQDKKRSDEAEAIRFLLIKAAIFILIPLAAAGLAVMFLMPK